MTLASLGGQSRYAATVFIVSLILIVRLGPGVRAASITVNANCSLPHAIIAANTDSAVSDCPAQVEPLRPDCRQTAPYRDNNETY